MTILRTLSTIDTNPKKRKKKKRKPAGDSVHMLTRLEFDDQGRTSGGIPLITGIKKMYKNSAIVSKPDSADTPTSNL